MSIVNGYAKSKDAFESNARLREVRFVMSGERQFRKTLRDTTAVQDIHGNFGTTEFLEIEILSVYPGNDPQLDDAAISEVDFFAE